MCGTNTEFQIEVHILRSTPTVWLSQCAKSNLALCDRNSKTLMKKKINECKQLTHHKHHQCNSFDNNFNQQTQTCNNSVIDKNNKFNEQTRSWMTCVASIKTLRNPPYSDKWFSSIIHIRLLIHTTISNAKYHFETEQLNVSET